MMGVWRSLQSSSISVCRKQFWLYLVAAIHSCSHFHSCSCSPGALRVGSLVALNFDYLCSLHSGSGLDVLGAGFLHHRFPFLHSCYVLLHSQPTLLLMCETDCFHPPLLPFSLPTSHVWGWLLHFPCFYFLPYFWWMRPTASFTSASISTRGDRARKHLVECAI